MLLLARIGFEYWADDLQASPLDAPLAVADGGAIDQRIRLRARDHYQMQLVFRKPAGDGQRLRELLEAPVLRDGQPVSEGVAVPLRWSLSEIDSGRVVAQGEPVADGLSGWGSDDFFRTVTSFSARPGWYRLQAQVTRPVPELAGVPTRLHIGLHPKATGSAQTEWAWFGRLICVFLDPLMALAALALAGWTIRDLIVRRRATASAAAA
ncbi:hypothetical protein J5226_14085 [Lysobacter sp. K5869]|uniref:DUF5625 family protein n=1 Tax=Lysobacter sp. K5869 TaxID=2820808 RepID=UPI001C061813|nr:DUF5625 family protein [Lysobacter sp. K5869]QWP74794.1 hypothetical protein J5226_14085 [Lysobacter sp. K5869]